MSNTNTYNGATTVNQGILTATILANGGANSSIGNSSSAATRLLLGNGTTLRYTGGAISTNRSFTINGTGAVSLTKSGTGTCILINAGNSYTGATTLAGGLLQGFIPGGIGTSGGTSAQIFNGGVLNLTGDFTRSLGSNTIVTAVNFTGTGGWAASGADRIVNLGGALAQITWATPDTGFNGQTLILGNAAATHKVTLQNGLDLGTATRTVQSDNGTASVDGELSGIIAGAGGALTKTGAGTLSLSNANTYSGRTTVNAGVLLLENATALPGGIGATGGTSNLTFTGGVLGLGAGNGNFERTLNNNTTANAVNFTNAGGWAVFGADRTVNLGGAGASVTWATANTGFNGQTVILGAANATHTVTLANALDLVTGTRTVQMDNGSAVIDAILSGNITGTGTNGLTKTGAGTLALSGTNHYSGTTQGPRSASGSIIFQGAQALSDNTVISYFNGGGVGGGPSYSILHDTSSTVTRTTGIFHSAADNTSGLGIFVGNNGAANGGNGAG